MTANTATLTVAVRPVATFVRIVCPECDCVNGAAIVYEERDPFPRYGHECIYCGYIITESEWNEVDDDPGND